MTEHSVDLAIIGGGINGAGIARDAASRGLSVLLCDKGDFACATSSASSKLIHGGLRYLEHMAIKFVRESLKERDILLKNAPHLVQPQRFIMPHDSSLRHAWLIKLGLFLYDHLAAGLRLPRSKSLRLKANQEENPLCLTYKKGFAYYDAIVDDARLVISNLIDAAQNGALIYPQTSLSKAENLKSHWQIELYNHISNKKILLKAKSVVNATGPWADTIAQNYFGTTSGTKLKLVKGSHIIVPKLYNHKDAYLLQHPDSRIVFVVPYHKRFTMIGTTDVDFSGNIEDIQCSRNETEYLCQIVSKYFHHPLKPQHVVGSWSGVRPLIDDGTSRLSGLSREYKLEVIHNKNTPMLINVFGGKLTTYRQLSEQVVNALQPHFKMGPCKTKELPLPGGDIPKGDIKAYIENLKKQYPYIHHKILKRMAHQYGTRCAILLQDVKSLEDLGTDLGYGLTEKELQFLFDHEWCTNIDDVLLRRTKLGLLYNQEQKENLARTIEIINKAIQLKAG